MTSQPYNLIDDSPLPRYQALLQVAESIASHRDMGSLLRDLNQKLHSVVQFDGTVIVLHNAATNTMRSYRLEADITAGIPVPTELPVDQAPGGLVWQTQQPMLVNDTGRETRFVEMNTMLRAMGVKSYCILPLTSAGRKLGAIGFSRITEAAYTEEDLEFLKQVVNQVAVAVENTLNFESAQASEQQLARERDRLRLMLELNNIVTSHLDLHELFQAISVRMREAFKYDFAGLGLYDPENDCLKVYALDIAENVNFVHEGIQVPLKDTPTGLSFTSGKVVLRKHLDIEEFPSEMARQGYAQGLRSGCIAPLISHNRKLGVLTMVSRREGAFTEDDAELLEQMARQVAIAVENALNYEGALKAQQEFARERDRLRMVLDVNNAVASNLDLHELFRAISESVRRVMSQDFAALALYDEEKGGLRIHTLDFPDNEDLQLEGKLISLDENTAGIRAFLSRQTVIINDPTTEDPNTPFVKLVKSRGLRSACAAPLLSHDRPLGIIAVASHRKSAFSEADAELLGSIANQISIAVENALSFREIEQLKNKLSSEKLYLEEELQTAYNFQEIIGQSQALRRILKQVETAAPTDSTILIQGETGTGKELIARAIHNLSERRERTLVKVNCAAIPTGLLESELFGHEKGAFTGAVSQRAGRFELANRGTLFLDEVGDIPLELQPKLLRVLQEQEFERLGSSRTIQVDVRLVAATNSDLEQMVADRKYRSDLYYRLNVFPITLPPLRERPEDIPVLARFFAQKFARRMRKRIESIPARSLEALTSYHWPGNVRELENFIERAVILSSGAELETPLGELKKADAPPAPAPHAPAEITTLESAERDHILRALKETNWVIGGASGAAARLGMKRTTLQSKMQKLGISRPV
jgi:formate hydrogenlyase transcriptional activator